MLPPWLSESDVNGGYEAPVRNLPQDDEIDDAPSRRRRGRSAAPEGGRQDPNATPGRKDRRRRLFGGRDKEERPEPETPRQAPGESAWSGQNTATPWSQPPPARPDPREGAPAGHTDPGRSPRHFDPDRSPEPQRHPEQRQSVDQSGPQQGRPTGPEETSEPVPRQREWPTGPEEASELGPRQGGRPTGHEQAPLPGPQRRDPSPELPTRQPSTPSAGFQPLGSNATPPRGPLDAAPGGAPAPTTRIQRSRPDLPPAPPGPESGAPQPHTGESPHPPATGRPPFPEPPESGPTSSTVPPGAAELHPPLPGPPPSVGASSATGEHGIPGGYGPDGGPGAPTTGSSETRDVPGTHAAPGAGASSDTAGAAVGTSATESVGAIGPADAGAASAAGSYGTAEPSDTAGAQAIPGATAFGAVGPNAGGKSDTAGSGTNEARRPTASDRAASEWDGPPPWLAPPAIEREGAGGPPAAVSGPPSWPAGPEAGRPDLPPAAGVEESTSDGGVGPAVEGERAQPRPDTRPPDRLPPLTPDSTPTSTYGPEPARAASQRTGGEQARADSPYGTARPESAPPAESGSPYGPVPSEVPAPYADHGSPYGPVSPEAAMSGEQARPSYGPMPTGADHAPDAPVYADPDAAAGYPPVPPSSGRHRLSPPEPAAGGPGHGAPGPGYGPPPGGPGYGGEPRYGAPVGDGSTPGHGPVAMPEGPGGHGPQGDPNAHIPPGAPHRAPVSDPLAPGERRDPGVFARPPEPDQRPPGAFPAGPPPEQGRGPVAPQWNSGAPGIAQPGGSWGTPPPGYRQGGPSLDDVPMRRAKKSPGSGWRKAVHHVSGGSINPGMSAEERRLQELVARIRQPVRGDYRIAVLSLKGGVGKTTTTMGLGSIFASVRGDRVIAVDANPDFGTLSQRVPLQTRSTVRDLLLDPVIERYSDVRRHTSQATSRLEVLASERDPAASEAFNDEEYRAVARILQRFYNIILTDCGTGLMHSAMTGVLDLAHSLVLISSAAIDGARSAAATLDWLSLHGHDHLVRNAVVVINLPREGSPNVGIQQLREYFLSRCRAVHIIPYDSHLSEGAEIDLHRLSKQAKRAYVELAATVADEFGVDHRHYHR